jgi:prolyl-tRNA synthetase
MLTAIHEGILQKATAFRDENIHDVDDYTDLGQVIENGWAFVWWCGSSDCEAQIKADTRATSRCIPLDQSDGEGQCIVCGKKSVKKTHFARAY